MEYEIVNSLPSVFLKGRSIKKAVGLDEAAIPSHSMSFGRTLFSRRSGIMDPHCHAEEIIYVLNASQGIVRFGPTEACSGGTVRLQPDMILHFAAGEWHVFETLDPEGYSDVLFFYAQTDHLRPENDGTGAR